MPLHENLEADVCVVGAGVAWLTSAYLLQKAGKSVIVLDDRFYRLESLFGEKRAKLAAESCRTTSDAGLINLPIF